MRETGLTFQRIRILRQGAKTKTENFPGRLVVQRDARRPHIEMKALFSFYLDASKIALQSIFAHKLRAFLTLIGIILGVS